MLGDFLELDIEPGGEVPERIRVVPLLSEERLGLSRTYKFKRTEYNPFGKTAIYERER